MKNINRFFLYLVVAEMSHHRPDKRPVDLKLVGGGGFGG